jgi:hypothetical protein
MALVNPEATDAFFGILVPSMFDGIVLGGQFIYEENPWHLVVIFVGIVYAFIHYYYILKVSKKLLHNVRREEHSNRTMQSSGSMWIVTRRLRGKYGWQRVMASLRVNVSKAVMCCSSPFTYFYAPRKAEEARVIALWGNMNVPNGYQGKTGGFRKNVTIALLTYTETVPAQIVDMCVYYERHQGRADSWLTRYMRSGVFGVDDDLVADSDFSPTYADEEGGKEDDVRSSVTKVHKNVLRADDTEFLTAPDRFRLTTLTDNFDDIIRRFPLFCIHVHYRDAELLQGKQMIRSACLRQFMEGVLCWFTPNGQALREFEKENVSKEFEEWLNSNRQQVDGVEAVSYGAFNAWLFDLKEFLTTATLVATLNEGHLERLSSLEAIRMSEIFRPSEGIFDEEIMHILHSINTADGSRTDMHTYIHDDAGDHMQSSSFEAVRLSEIFGPSDDLFDEEMVNIWHSKATAHGSGANTGGGAGDRKLIDSFSVASVEPKTDILATLRDSLRNSVRESVESLDAPRFYDAAQFEEVYAYADYNEGINTYIDIGKEKLSFDVTLRKATLPEPEHMSNRDNEIDLSPRLDKASSVDRQEELEDDGVHTLDHRTTPADVDPGDAEADPADGNEHNASAVAIWIGDNIDADLPPMSLDEMDEC